MARCWTCGAHIERPLFTCPACRTVKEVAGLRKEAATNLEDLRELEEMRKKPLKFRKLEDFLREYNPSVC